ncbi:UbiA family prenyltransferase [Paraburkholderia pallida]|uniref:Prenyltransferase n=1 Tax=Paraburkholderia pallida TaxID=2547399 RepID=A0A4P7CYD1_9BURK|nr:UbiA family prenyltransferase [Paraburkholderia pallida]QBQ99141.1 prenyltransferase [Paraburkholderia pallida]
MSTLSSIGRVGPLLALCRVSNLPTVWSNVLTAAVLAGAASPASGAAVVLLALALSAFYCGGMALNDLCDLGYDSVHQRYRPIPAGRITLARAQTATVALFALALGCLLLAPHREGLAGGAALFAVIAFYDRFHKRFASTVFAMAAARVLVYVVTALALEGAVAGPVWFAGAVQGVWVLLLTFVARRENRAPGGRYAWPVIPWMLAAIALCDGIVLTAFTAQPAWLLAGVGGALLTRVAQRYVRGD